MDSPTRARRAWVAYAALPMDTSSSLTVAARMPEPYVHLDNRGLVVSNGERCVMVPSGQFRWAAETLAVIGAEGRATRHQGDHVLGGFAAGDEVVLFAGTTDDLVTVTLQHAALEELRSAISQ
jgi:hypothetical protein